jgi:hypothetical protein
MDSETQERSNKPAESETGDTKQDSPMIPPLDPLVTPPSHPPRSRQIFFQYAESSMNFNDSGFDLCRCQYKFGRRRS